MLGDKIVVKRPPGQTPLIPPVISSSPAHDLQQQIRKVVHVVPDGVLDFAVGIRVCFLGRHLWQLETLASRMPGVALGGLGSAEVAQDEVVPYVQDVPHVEVTVHNLVRMLVENLRTQDKDFFSAPGSKVWPLHLPYLARATVHTTLSTRTTGSLTCNPSATWRAAVSAIAHFSAAGLVNLSAR